MISSQKTCQDYCYPNGCNCYKVLNVAKRAQFSDIKKTYRTLAQQYHPDLNPGKDTSAKFAEIANCYEILKDERSRAQYNQCMEYGYNSYSARHPGEPGNNGDSLWGLLIPLISFFMNRIRGQRNPQQNEQNPQPQTGGQKVKKILKWIGFIVAFGIAAALFMFYAPDFMTEPVYEAWDYVYELFGGNIIYMLLFGSWAYSMIKWVIQKIYSLFSSLFVKPSKEEEIKSFFTHLRNTIDQFHDKILQKAKNNKQKKEDETIWAKEQELEILKRSHSENLSFVKQPSENEEENQDLLKTEKEDELEKMHKRNIELCESRSEEKLKQESENLSKFIESHNKTCEYYRKLASDAEKDIETKLKEKTVSHEKVKEELQKLANDIAAKMSTVWQVDNSEDQQN